MQKTFTFVITLLLFTAITRAQADNTNQQKITDTIRIKKTFGGNQFFVGEKQLKLKELEKMLQPNETAYKLMRSSKAPATVATVLGIAGGFMIGWPLGTAIAGGSPNWALAGAGAGLVAISIPFGISSNKKIIKAVNTYNATAGNSTSYQQYDLKFQVTNNGVGLAYNF